MKIIWRAITVAFLVTIFIIVFHDYHSLGYGFTNIGFKKGTFIDRSRERNIQYFLWYPAVRNFSHSTSDGPWVNAPVAENAPIDLQIKDKYPLILISHGFDGSPGDQSWIAESLVAKGFIVCGVKHPDRHSDTKIVSPPWNRPLDISFAISELLYSDFGSYIDQNQIGFVGFSMGALTGIWLSGGITNLFSPGTFYPTKEFVHDFKYFNYLKDVRWDTFDPFKKSYRDSRIKAVFLMAPSWSWVFNKEGLEKIKMPIQIVAPEDDNLIVTQSNAERYARLIPKAKIFLFSGKLSHYVFLNGIYDWSIPDYDSTGEKKHLYENLPGMSRDRVHEKTVNLAAEFFYSHLRS